MELSAQLVHEPKQAKCCNHALIPICNTPTSRFRDLRPPVTQILCQFESPVSEIPMDSRSPHVSSTDGRSRSFRDFARCEVKMLTFLFCFPMSESPKWVISRHVSSLNRTVQIYFGTSTMECPDLLSSRPPKSRSPKSRYQLLFRDFRLCSRGGLNPHASPDRSNGCRVF
jgi:hypothetical protein